MRAPSDSEKANCDAYWLILSARRHPDRAARYLALAEELLKPIVGKVEDECAVESYDIFRERDL